MHESIRNPYLQSAAMDVNDVHPAEANALDRYVLEL